MWMWIHFWHWTTRARQLEDSLLHLEVSSPWKLLSAFRITAKSHHVRFSFDIIYFTFHVFSAPNMRSPQTQIYKLLSSLGTCSVFNQYFCDKAVWSRGQQTSSIDGEAGWWWQGHDAAEIKRCWKREEKRGEEKQSDWVCWVFIQEDKQLHLKLAKQRDGLSHCQSGWNLHIFTDSD